MAKYYAHSNFPIEIDEWGIARKTISVGEEISQQKLGVSKEDWEEYVAMGAVSEEEYPDIPDDVPLNEWKRQQANLDAIEDGVKELRMSAGLAPATVTEPVVPSEPATAPSGMGDNK